MNYELMVLCLPQKEASAKKIFNGVSSLLKSLNASEISEDYWGKRDLAYKIKSSDAGFYSVFTFSLDPEQAPKLSSELKLNEDIVRFLLTKLK